MGGVGRLGGREAQSAMMRWGSFLHLRGPGCEGHPAEPPSPTVAISKPQPLFFPETPTALAHTSLAPQGPRLGGWRLRVWPLLDLVQAGGWGGPSVGGVGTGCWVVWCLWELCCWDLDSYNPRDPTPTPEKPGGCRITLFSAPLLLTWFGGNSAGKESIVRLVAPASQPFCGGRWVEWAGVAAARSRLWPKAPFPWGRGPGSGPGACSRDIPFPLHKRGRCNSGGVGSMRCPADGTMSWVLEVRIGTKRLYEAHLFDGEGDPDKRHPWGQ